MTDVSPHFDFVPYRRELVGRLAPVLDTGLEKEDLVTYMFSCPVILSTRIMTPDEVDPSRDPIPLIFFTDCRFDIECWTRSNDEVSNK
jgi:hypothetical protein